MSGKHRLLNKIAPKEVIETVKKMKKMSDNVEKKGNFDRRKIKNWRKSALDMDKDEIDVMDANKAYESQILNITKDERSTRSQPDSEFSSSNAQFYKCPFCPKTETYHSNLKNHVAKVHFAKEMSIDKSQKQCYFCGKPFTSRNNLVNI